MASHGMVWYGMVWYGMVRIVTHAMVVFKFCNCSSSRLVFLDPPLRFVISLKDAEYARSGGLRLV